MNPFNAPPTYPSTSIEGGVPNAAYPTSSSGVPLRPFPHPDPVRFEPDGGLPNPMVGSGYSGYSGSNPLPLRGQQVPNFHDSPMVYGGTTGSYGLQPLGPLVVLSPYTDTSGYYPSTSAYPYNGFSGPGGDGGYSTRYPQMYPPGMSNTSNTSNSLSMGRGANAAASRPSMPVDHDSSRNDDEHAHNRSTSRRRRRGLFGQHRRARRDRSLDYDSDY